MSGLIEVCRVSAVAVVLCLIAAVLPAAAQMPGSKLVNPTAESVKEEQLLKELQRIQGRGTIPDTKSYVIEQPAGRDWREFRQYTLPRIGLIANIGMVALLALFLLVRGRVRVENGFSGRTIERFNAVERFGHWLTATSFVVLALTGLNVTFGRSYLLPVVGPESFTLLSQWAKYLHNYMSFAFVLGLILLFVLWVIYNLPTPRDITWIAEGGGMVGHKHPPAGRFNAGQKILFWIVTLGGFALAVTGYILMFPFYNLPPSALSDLNTTVGALQMAQILHGLIGLVMIAIIIAHIYIGTIGMQGAFSSMGSGQVDVNWVRQHHSVWADKVLGKEGAGSAMPAE
jgi:formate dehydrogenase subunit gamma